MSQRIHEKIDKLSASYGEDISPDVEAGLHRLHASIGQLPQREASVRPLPNYRRWLSIAAGVLLAVAAGWFLLRDDATVLNNATNGPLAVALPDGTEVILQQGASLSYDDEFLDTERNIDLEGQGFFKVAKDAQKPFLVHANGTTLRVTGTEFNLRVDGEELEVEVSEGSVNLEYEDEVVAVGLNQCGLAKAGVTPVLMEAPYLNRHAWYTGKLVFNEAPIRQVLNTIHSNWGVSVTLPQACDFVVNSTYSAKSSSDIPSILEQIGRQAGGQFLAVDKANYTWRGDCR